VHSAQGDQLQYDDGSPAAGVCQDNEEEPNDELEVSDGRDGSGVTRLPDTDKHPRVQNRYEHQPVAGRQTFGKEDSAVTFFGRCPCSK
jgi:hypothetical protein